MRFTEEQRENLRKDWEATASLYPEHLKATLTDEEAEMYLAVLEANHSESDEMALGTASDLSEERIAFYESEAEALSGQASLNISVGNLDAAIDAIKALRDLEIAFLMEDLESKIDHFRGFFIAEGYDGNAAVEFLVETIKFSCFHSTHSRIERMKLDLFLAQTFGEMLSDEMPEHNYEDCDVEDCTSRR